VSKYYAIITFSTDTFEASNKQEADDKLNEFVDELSKADTSISWDNVDWVIYNEEEDNE
jgi:hypothetical protein